MKVLFVYNGSENMGIEYLSSMLKSKGHEVSLLFDPAVFSGHSFLDIKFLGKMFNLDDKIVEKAIKQKPDLICFSCFTGNYRWCLDIANRIKAKSNAPIAFGGIHSTAVPQTVLKNKCVDFVMIGECEYAILDLVDYLKEHPNGINNVHIHIKNIGYKIDGKLVINPPRPYIRDLDSIPFPDKSLFLDKVPTFSGQYGLMTTRGCPYLCTYCSNSMLHKLYKEEKNHIRRRSVKNVIGELKLAKEKYDVHSVIFLDDVFTLSLDWLKDFIPVYKKEIGLEFSCLTQPNSITKEMIDLLKNGGCTCIGMGVQSGSQRIRKDIFKRYESNDKVIEACKIIKQGDIKLYTDFILGSPTETEKEVKQGLELLEKIKPDRLSLFFLNYYPGTEIVDIGIGTKTIEQKQYEEIKRGIIAYTRTIEGIDKEKEAMYSRYWLFYQLRVLFDSDKLYKLFSKIARNMPFKPFLAMLTTFLVSVKIRNVRYVYQFKYMISKKNVP